MINQLKGTAKSVQKCASIRGRFLPNIITNKNSEDVECILLHLYINYCLHSSSLILLLCTLQCKYYLSVWKHEHAEDTKSSYMSRDIVD
jgi:hypothetical protein